MKNEIRKNAKEIFGFFDNRNVQIRVISGDNPITVSSIAKQAGIKGYEKYIDYGRCRIYRFAPCKIDGEEVSGISDYQSGCLDLCW